MTIKASKGKRPTQADVARLAGVSQSVVSFVLNDNPVVAISAKTRERVREAIDALGYVPDGTARSLRTRKTLTIAGIIPDITNPYHPAFERGIQDVAEHHGYDLVTYNTDGMAEKERKCLSWARRGRVDGVIITPFHLTVDDLRTLLDLGIPVIVHGQMRHHRGPCPFDRVFIDNVTAATTAVTYLLDRGHARIGMIAGAEGTPPRELRLQGYRRALGARGVPVDGALIRAGDFAEEGGYRAMRELLTLRHRPTAVFADSDLAAIGAMIAVGDSGLRVPDDVAVVGFDDIQAARLVTPRLTTIASFPERVGRRAAELLFERLAGTAPAEGRIEIMPHELTVRGSA
jgi:LacI family transcriptional regulator